MQLDTYLAQPTIALPGDNDCKLAKIADQKWLGLFLVSAEAYLDLRRTGLPDIFNNGRLATFENKNLQVPLQVFLAHPILHSFIRPLYYLPVTDCSLLPTLPQHGTGYSDSSLPAGYSLLLLAGILCHRRIADLYPQRICIPDPS